MPKPSTREAPSLERFAPESRSQKRFAPSAVSITSHFLGPHMDRVSHSTIAKTRYIGRATNGSVFFFLGPGDVLLLETVDDGISLFIGELQDSNLMMKDHSRDISVRLKGGSIIVDVPIVSATESGDLDFFQIELSDLLLAVDKGYVKRSNIRFDPSIVKLAELIAM